MTKPPNGWPARVAVLGAGSIGSYIGTLLSRAGQDVTLVDQWPEHVEALHSGPMRISGPDIDDAVPVRALHLHQLQAVEEPFDLLLLAVKGYDTDWAATLARGVLASNGAVLVCQNGLTDARVARIVGAERTLGCVITIAAAMAGPGQVARTDRYDIGFRVGELDGHVTARAQRLAELMSAAGGAEAIADLAAQRWSKLATNCMVNAVAGITGLGAGEIRSDPAVLPVVAQLAAETITVGWSLGHEVSPIMGIAARQFVDAADGRGLAELGERLRSASRSTSGHPPSLLQDVRRGRRTEINELNGEVARLGAEQGIATPLCDTVVRIVSQAGIGRLVPDLANLSLLLDALPATARSPLM